MIFKPEKYGIDDKPMQSFIDPEEIWSFISNAKTDRETIRSIIAKSLDKQRLSLEETAVLVQVTDPEMIEEIKEGARLLKEKVYGNRIVLFAPLYVGSLCTNDCQYCGFRTSNKKAERSTLNREQLVSEVEALEDTGQKRLILVFGEHPKYSADFIAEATKTVYSVKKGNGEIRRTNINAAPLDIEGFKKVHEAGIGTYQVFQETYHPETYKKYHLSGRKSDYNNRLTSLDRAQEAGLDDVGIGALFGLYDWRFEVLSLVRHTNHLEACYNVGPHTISFPRIQDASDINIDTKYLVSDEEFTRIIAILRLAVPYTGLILTAREKASIRKEVMRFGVSQIDGGTKIEIGAYADKKNNQEIDKEQFRINDDRALSEVIDELLSEDYLPSFCTACYRLGRTGEHFMEFSVPGFIKRFCSPNAILTLAEYLEDYAPVHVFDKGWQMIEKNLNTLNGETNVKEIKNRLERIKQGERDIYF
ncbi:MAG: [FeFe] hydrogenase H-cluster radical SAM maturase HydG [Bacteroidales bacterium]|nr:[FeFe] hydrogenase H-cluster radical SAM maturase HydG [Bacteroidales bacterium]MBN2818994.1 [FeFe] hydrogenase H-cluster radical SAM maturase HydG [Bacteroidales bacterium]